LSSVWAAIVVEDRALVLALALARDFFHLRRLFVLEAVADSRLIILWYLLEMEVEGLLASLPLLLPVVPPPLPAAWHISRPPIRVLLTFEYLALSDLAELRRHDN
jgi:hypothetical protein